MTGKTFRNSVNPRLLACNAKFELLLRIEDKNFNGRAPDSGAADNEDAIPTKVSRPSMPTRVEELRQLSSLGIITGDIASLMQVAIDASKGKAAELVSAAMLLGPHVFNVKTCVGRLILVQAAVFTAVAGSVAHGISSC